MSRNLTTVVDFVQNVVDEAYQDDTANTTETFSEDTVEITVPQSFADSILEGDTEDFQELDCVSETQTNDTETYTIEYKLWMTYRRPTQKEVDAAIRGVEDVQSNSEPQDENGDFSDTEVVFYRKGYEEGVPNDEQQKPEKAIAGKLPKVIVYHRDEGYSGPKYMGQAVDFNGITEYDPCDTDQMIENGEIIGGRTHEYPEFECNTSDGKTYIFGYWIEP